MLSSPFFGWGHMIGTIAPPSALQNSRVNARALADANEDDNQDCPVSSQVPPSERNQDRNTQARAPPLKGGPGTMVTNPVGDSADRAENVDRARPSGSGSQGNLFESVPARQQSDFPLRGIFVHCLTSHDGRELTFTSDRKPVENRPRMTTKIGRFPYVLEVVEFQHPQSHALALWTLPTTASFVCDCMQIHQPEKSEWCYLYQCMLRIRQELYADSQRIQNAFEIGALEIKNDKWKLSQSFFQRHPSFRPIGSLARLKQHLMTDHVNFFQKDIGGTVGNTFASHFFLRWTSWFPHCCYTQKFGP